MVFHIHRRSQLSFTFLSIIFYEPSLLLVIDNSLFLQSVRLLPNLVPFEAESFILIPKAHTRKYSDAIMSEHELGRRWSLELPEEEVIFRDESDKSSSTHTGKRDKSTSTHTTKSVNMSGGIMTLHGSSGDFGNKRPSWSSDLPEEEALFGDKSSSTHQTTEGNASKVEDTSQATKSGTKEDKMTNAGEKDENAVGQSESKKEKKKKKKTKNKKKKKEKDTASPESQTGNATDVIVQSEASQEPSKNDEIEDSTFDTNKDPKKKQKKSKKKKKDKKKRKEEKAPEKESEETSKTITMILKEGELGQDSDEESIDIDVEGSVKKSIMLRDAKGSIVPRRGSRVTFGPKVGRAYSRRTSKGFRTTFAKTRETVINDNFRVSKNPTQMKLECIEAFFYNHGMEIALGSLFLALNLTMAAHGAYQFSEIGGWTPPNNVLRVTLPIARAAGRLVTLNCAILLLTGCKYLWTLVRTYVAPVVPIGFPIDDVMPKYHRYVALTVIFSGCVVHTIPQIVNYASRSITMDHEGIRVWTFGNGFATKQLLVTGTLLAIIFSTFYFTTLQAFRKTAAGFRWFWMFHGIGIATAYPLLLIHGTCRGHPIFLYFAILPLVLYLFDVSMRRRNIASAKVLRWRVHDDDGQQITELVLERPKDFSYTPGQYAELKFEPISTREWHPFTIASSPEEDETSNNEVVFYIKNAGRWTGALADYAAAFDLSKARSPPNIYVRGPHGAPAMNYTEYKHIIVIGSGVGVTPLLSIWNYLLEKGKALANEKSIDYQKLPMSFMSSDRRKVMKEKSSRVMQQSMNIFNDESKSSRFLTDFSRSFDFLGNQSMQLGSLGYFENFDLTSDEEKSEVSPSTHRSFGKFRSIFIFLAIILESMTVSIPLFVLFVFAETATICFQFAGWYMAANVVASSLSLIALVVYGTHIVACTIAAGWSIYFRLFKCWLECSLIVANGFALWFSIRGCMLARGQIDAAAWDFTNSVISISVVIFLQAIRIFHMFYTTLKVQSSAGDTDRKSTRKSIALENGEELCSVDGIVINRKYSNMKFAARNILPRILQEGLSDVFSMEFYGTREKPKEKDDHSSSTEKITEHSLVGDMMGSVGRNINVRGSMYYANKAVEEQSSQEDFFCAGRPDWNIIFLKAISKAHAANEEGESVGVFFCGSPAIAKALNSEAKKVTAQHQFAMNCLNGKRCKCKLIVHSENF